MDPATLTRLLADLKALTDFAKSPSLGGLVAMLKAAADAQSIILAMIPTVTPAVAQAMHSHTAVPMMAHVQSIEDVSRQLTAANVDMQKINWPGLLGSVLSALPGILQLIGPVLGGVLGAGS